MRRLVAICLMLCAGTISAQAQRWQDAVQCPAKGAFKSALGGARQSVTFHNKSPFSLQLWWLDGSGNKKFLRDLAVGSSYTMATYVGHVLVAAGFGGMCAPVFTVRSGVASHTFR